MKKIKFDKVKDFFINFGINYPILSFYIISNFINSILLRLFTTGSFKIRPLFFDLAIVLYTYFNIIYCYMYYKFYLL